MPLPRRPRAALAAGLVASLLLAPLVALAVAAPAAAARGFTPEFSANTNGAVLIRGNTSMTCVAGATCTTAQGGTGTDRNNNNFSSTFVDVDADPGTFSSSTAQLTVPAGGGVLYAALVWGGRTDTSGGAVAAPAVGLKNQVRLSSGAGYATVVADRVDELTTGTTNAYQGYADVTSAVRAATTPGGTTSWTVADVQATRGTDRYAGWSLVVVVSDPLAPARNLTVFSGFDSVSGARPNLDIALSGFLTPPSGPVKTSLGFVTYEGDLGSVGDSLLLDGQQLSDGRNAANNVFNSSITDHGTDTAGRSPSYANQLGFDADQVAADGILDNGATSATISLSTGGETYFPGVVTFATELFDPKLLGTKTVTDLDGAPVEPGDVLEYAVPVENIGLDVADESTFFDAVPTGTSYVLGSLSLDLAPLTDVAGDDNGSFVADANQGHLLVHVGDGATPSTGGSVPADESERVVRFRVTVDATAGAGQEILNAAALTYRGATTRAASGSATNAVLRPVVTAPLPGGNTKPVAGSHIESFTPAPGARALTLAVLADDTDVDGQPLTIVGVTDAAGGSVAVGPGGTIVYSPRDGFAGRDVFTYTISDGNGGTSTASVQVDVLNTVPVGGDDAASTPAGVPVVVPVLADDTDANGDTVAVRSVQLTTANGGSVSPLPDGTVRYTPAAGFRGTDSFTYVVEDSRGGSDTATVTITVENNVPTGGADSAATQAGAAAVVDVLDNDADTDATDTLAVVGLTDPAGGAVVANADGTVTYTPDPGFTGTDTFTYRVSDGQGGTSAPVTVTVRVNAAPVAVDDSGSLPTDGDVTLDVAGDDTDSDGDTLSVTSVTQGAHGGVVVDAGGTVTYTPVRGWAGVDTFTYVVSDGRGGTDTGTVTVTTDNADPVAGPDAVAAGPEEEVSVDVLLDDTDANILGTDPEPTDQVLVLTGAATDDDAVVAFDPDGTVTVTPGDGFKGDITVTYTVSDGAGGEATGTLTVTVGDAAPVASPDGPVGTPTGASVLIDVLADDTDPNGDVLSVVTGSLTPPVDADGDEHGTAVLEGGQVRYTPPAGFAGTVTFSYTVTDGELESTALVTVVVANAPPVATDDTAGTAAGTPVTVDVLGDDTDANVPGTDQELSVTAAGADAGATVVVEADGRLTVTPAAGYKGAVVVTYTVADGAGGTDTGTLTVTVGDAAPVAGPDSATTPYATAVTVDLLDDDTDANGDALSVVPGSITAPVDGGGTARGSVSLAGGRATYTPPAGFSGVVTFSYTVTDGDLQSTATVTVTVGNASPVAAPESVTVAGKGGPVTLDVLRNDSDADGGTLRLVSVTQPAHGSVAVVGGSVVYTPEPGFTGQVTFAYTVADGQGGTTTATVTLDVVAGDVAGDAGARPGPGRDGSWGDGGGTALPTRLARTGVEVTDLVLGATVLLGAGAALLVGSRRRRPTVERHRHRG